MGLQAGPCGSWNKQGVVVAGDEQRSDNPELELCEPEKVP